MKRIFAVSGSAAILLASVLFVPTVRVHATASWTNLIKVWILNSQIDSTPIGATIPSTGSFTTLAANNGISSTSVTTTFQGQFGTSGFSPLTSGTPQGAIIGWNGYGGTGGVGGTNIINSKGSGSGGFTWFNIATGATSLPSPLMTLDASGNLGTSGTMTAPGGFVGNAASATALASAPTNCGSTIPAYGIATSGNALCVTQTNRTCNANGCYKVSPDGTIQAWGTSGTFGGAVSGTQGVTFPVTFTNTSNLSITVSSTACTDVGGACGSGIHPYTCTAQRSSLTTSGVTMYYDGNGSTVQSGQCSWQAIGY